MPEEQQVESEAASSHSRRQRRKRRNKATFWTNPALPRRTTLLVAALALLASAFSVYKLRQGSLLFGQVQIGAPQAEVAYLYGQPPRTEANGAKWLYPVGADAELAINFDADRAILSMDCIAHSATAFGCPTVAGIGLGTPEDQLLNRLGPASSQTYIPNGKTLTFDDMGVTFTLHQFRVTGYSKVRRTSRIAYLSRVAWNLLP